MPRIRLSKHGKERIEERTSVKDKAGQRDMFKNALHKGKSPHEIGNEELRSYLLKKSKYCKVKLYNNYLFIYSKNTHRLYTMYELPEKLKNIL